MNGILILNLGTAAEPTPKAIRAYLKEFLSDPMVVDGPPRWLWWLILRLAILPRRPAFLVPQYKSIWLNQGPPLVVHTQAQVAALQQRFGDAMRVTYAMRYGTPSIADGLQALARRGATQITVLPMFPHASKSTTGTAQQEIEEIMAGWQGKKPAIDVVAPFFDHPAFIQALANRIRQTASAENPDHYLFSYHGIPVRFVEEGDPYQAHCEATTAALVQELGLQPDQYTHAYQSRFGREPWLEPETAAVIKNLAGIHRRVLAVCPGFPADCLETVEEIGKLGRASFKESGGEDLVLVPGLNADPDWISAIRSLLAG